MTLPESAPAVDRPRKVILYHFRFEDGAEQEFQVELDEETLAMIRPPRASYPHWTALDFHRCAICTLEISSHPRCPIAANMIDLVDFFGGAISHTNCEVSVVTTERTYTVKTTLQRGISALMGIFMVSSGCPIMSRLRPMVDTHLPFATTEETIYRTLSMYMLAQHFRAKRGLECDLEFKGLLKLLDEVHHVDRDFCKRLRAVQTGDANLNALVILCNFGQSTGFSLEENELTRLERIYLEYYGA